MVDYPAPARLGYLHTIDMCVMLFSREKKEIQVLLHKREKEPYQGKWALPGIVVNGDTPDNTLEDAVERLRASPKVGIDLEYVEQVGTVGDAVRDPRCWSSSTIYLAIASKVPELDDSHMLISIRDVIRGVVRLPFDHAKIIGMAYDRMASKSLYSSLPLKFLGREFSAPEARMVFSEALARDVFKSSLRQRLNKMIADGFIKETGRKKTGDDGRAQSTYEIIGDSIYLFDRSFSGENNNG